MYGSNKPPTIDTPRYKLCIIVLVRSTRMTKLKTLFCHVNNGVIQDGFCIGAPPRPQRHTNLMHHYFTTNVVKVLLQQQQDHFKKHFTTILLYHTRAYIVKIICKLFVFILPVIALVHFYFEPCPEHNSETHLVGVQCIRTVTIPCLILELLPFVHFNTMNFVRDITLKLQEV